MEDKIKQLTEEVINNLNSDEISEIVEYVKNSDKKFELVTFLIDKVFVERLFVERLEEDDSYSIPENYRKIMSSFNEQLKEIDQNPSKYTFETV